MENDTIILNDAKKGRKYYAVRCKCGHVGPHRYVEIVFGVRANNGREAARKARQFARVKHHQKYAIINCYEISRKEYNELLKANSNDPYLRCKNIQEQRKIEGFDSRIIQEPEKLTLKKSKKERKSFVQYKLKKQKQFIDMLGGNQYAW